jgi:hypothetical protein
MGKGASEMDGERFDSLTRVVARNGSRRGLLRGLAGAVGLLVLGRRSSRVAAQSGYLGPGEACYDDSQCGNTRYNEMFCADNGFDYDGALNCCAYEGGFCYGDEGCCGIASCITGSCVSPPSNVGAIDSELNQTGYGFPPGQACISDSQCDNSYPELGIAYCADTGAIYGAYGGTQHCCRYEGGSCGGPLSDDHSLCCGNLLCLGGTCGWG